MSVGFVIPCPARVLNKVESRGISEKEDNGTP
jgi:hypothetical protein